MKSAIAIRVDGVVEQAANINIFKTFVALDGELALVDELPQAIEGIAERLGIGFAGGAVAGDEGVVVQTFVAIVNFLELVVEDDEKISLVAAAEPNTDFAIMVAFYDLGTGAIPFENYAIFPDESGIRIGDTFNVSVQFDDEAGEDAFGHEAFVAIA